MLTLDLRRRSRSPPTAPLLRARAELRALLSSKALGAHRFANEGMIGPYLVDHVCFERSVIVQLDASRGTAGAAQEVRAAFLSGMGYTVIQVSPRELSAEPRRVLQRILAALR